MSISIRVRPALFAADIHITGIFIHIAGIPIHIRPESLFTSLRNPYSHRPEYAAGFKVTTEAGGQDVRDFSAKLGESDNGKGREKPRRRKRLLLIPR